MSRVCAVSGRRTRVGNSVARRGLAKKDGGVGRRVTGRSKRKFKANIQGVRVLGPDGSVIRMRVCTKIIRAGFVTVQKGGKMVRIPLVRATRGRRTEYLRSQPAQG
jgi:large subunit ribosomal protein L28